MSTHPQKQKTSYTTFLTLIIIVVIGLVTYQIYKGYINPKIGTISKDHLQNMSFNGVVQSFTFLDDKAHTKVAVLSDGSKYNIYEQWVYYIDAGDTLIKKEGDLKIMVLKPHGRHEMLDYAPLLRKLELTGGRHEK